MKNHFRWGVWAVSFVVVASVAVLAFYGALGAQGQTVPKYKFDPDWPKRFRTSGKWVE
jgi:hypothetical protein